jgi:hypothetical protein
MPIVLLVSEAGNGRFAARYGGRLGFDGARVLLKWGLDPDAPYVMRRGGADVLAGTLAKAARLTMVDMPSGPRLRGPCWRLKQGVLPPARNRGGTRMSTTRKERLPYWGFLPTLVAGPVGDRVLDGSLGRTLRSNQF